MTQGCKCAIRPPGPFSDWDDYYGFKEKLDSSSEFEPCPVGSLYSNVGLIETWHRCKQCQSVWRLVEPDPPFAGVWEAVKASS